MNETQQLHYRQVLLDLLCFSCTKLDQSFIHNKIYTTLANIAENLNEKGTPNTTVHLNKYTLV